MQIVWDEPKRLSNVEKHGFDFADLTEDFFLAARFVPTRSGRLVAYGPFAGRTVTVVFQPLGVEGVSIISKRASSKLEKRTLG